MNPLRSLISYFQGVQTELRKVVWPTVPVLANHFFSVIIGITLATIFVGAVDYVFIHAVAYVITIKK
jgi:preprotein translocase SecE subunit